MAEIRISADLEEAVRAMGDVGDKATKGAKTAADAVAMVGRAWTEAGATSAKVLKEQAAAVDRITSAAAKFKLAQFQQVQGVNAASLDMAKRQRAGEISRVNDANLDLAKRHRAGEISASIGEATINAAKGPGKAEASGVIGELTSKFGGLVSVTAALSLAMAAFKFTMNVRNENRTIAAALSTDMGERKKQLGKDAASLGLSAEQIHSAQNAGSMTTVAENEQFLHDVAAKEEEKGFAMPKARPGEVMGALDSYKLTGNRNIAGVFGMPQAVPGNIETLIKMRLAQDAGNPNDVPNGLPNYLRRVPTDARKETVLEANLSEVDDRNAKDRYEEGIRPRIAAAGYKLQRESGEIGLGFSIAETMSDWMDISSTNYNRNLMVGKNAMPFSEKETTDMRASAAQARHIREMRDALVKPPKPARRDGDK